MTSDLVPLEAVSSAALRTFGVTRGNITWQFGRGQIAPDPGHVADQSTRPESCAAGQSKPTAEAGDGTVRPFKSAALAA